MTPPAQDNGTAIISELIDLEGISLEDLKSLDNTAFSRACQCLQERADRPIKTETTCSSLSSF
jgi:hypothetical protein